jgi:hypothetical protein
MHGLGFRHGRCATIIGKHILPVSRIILAGGSGYFKTRFTSGIGSASGISYELEVEPGEADAARAVLKSFYTGKVPEPEQASFTDLILMFKMADRLQANLLPKLVEAMTSLDLSLWDWEAVVLVR